VTRTVGWAVALTLTLALLAAPAGAAPVARLGHDGRWLTDSEGRVVVLHGFNMVNKRPPYAPDAVGFGDDDAAFLAAEGFDSVRLGVIYKAVEPSPGVYDDVYLNRIAGTVAALARHGIVSMLDFHQDLYNERFQGEGWPDWAVQDDGLPAAPQAAFPGNYLLMPALQRTFDHFFANDPGPGGVGMQDRYAAAWRHVAQRFHDVPGVMGYELLNEPWPGTVWQPCASVVSGCPDFDAKLTAFTRRVDAAIRQADPRTLVFYEPNVLFNNSPPTHMGPIGDPHAGFAFHDYCLLAPSPACDPIDDKVFANADARSKETGDAVLLTEFGATDDASILGSMASRADRFMVGWEEWHYCGCDDPTTSGPGATQAIVLDPTRPPVGANVKGAKVALLGRPHPRAVAGTPLSWGTDDSGRFALRYETDRATGWTTQIATPPRAYPGGYAATADGASVVSPPDAPVLELAACPGAREVRVTVRRGSGSTGSCVRELLATARPRALRAGRSRRVVVSVASASRPVSGARVALGASQTTTGADGTATLRVRIRRPGRYRVSVTAPGSKPVTVAIRVRR